MVTLCLFTFFFSWARGASQSHASLESFGAACASATLAAWTCWCSGCFQPCLCTTVEQPGLRWHCVTPSSTAAGQLGHDSAAPQHEWGWSVDSGKLVVSALLPTLYLICVLLCNQPKRMFPFNQPVILTALPQQSPVLLLEIDTCHETLIIQKIASRHSSEKWILWDIFGQLRRSKLCKKVPTVTFPPEPRSRIWTDLHK